MQITQIQQAKKDPNRVNVFLDDKFWVGLDKSELLNFTLFKGKEITEEEKILIEKSSSLTKTKNKVLRYISIRPRSKKEVSLYLQRKNVEKEEISKVIVELEDKEYLSDYNFALWLSENRVASGKYGINKIQAELISKGVSKEVIKEILKLPQFLSEENKENQQDIIRNLVAKFSRTIKYKNPRELKDKLIQRLMARGFKYEDIKKEINKEI